MEIPSEFSNLRGNYYLTISLVRIAIVIVIVSFRSRIKFIKIFHLRDNVRFKGIRNLF